MNDGDDEFLMMEFATSYARKTSWLGSKLMKASDLQLPETRPKFIMKLQLNIFKKFLHAVEPAFGLGAVAVFFFF